MATAGSSVVETGLCENFVRPNMLCDECVIDESDGFRGVLVLVLVVLVGLGGRRARRGTRGVSPIARSISAISRLPCAKVRVVRNFEGGKNDRLETIHDGETFHVGEDLADYADFKEVMINIVHSADIPRHETA